MSGVSVDTVQRTGLRVPEPGKGDVQTLPSASCTLPAPGTTGREAAPPLLWETLPRFQNESAVGRRRQLQGVPLRPAGTSACSGSIHPLWVGRLRQAPSPADLPQAWFLEGRPGHAGSFSRTQSGSR